MTTDLDKARAALARVFGFAAFRPGQEQILAAIFAGENVLAVMPTGSGKSLLYQLPALVRPGLTVVVSPLIALMRDQVDQLRAYGLSAGALNSANSPAETARVERALRERSLQLVFIAPERLARPDVPGLLRAAGANFLAIDEAHCISQWGHDFRKDYLGQRAIARSLGAIQTIAVTATADAPTRAEIAEKLFTEPPQVFVRSFDRPNLRLAMRPKANATRQIARMIEAHRGDSGIVYCGSRRRTEKLAADLVAAGHRALPYHAGMESSQRGAHQDEFLRSDGIVMVATIAFGMGIDKPDVRFVCHADLPGSLEAYYQEIGRAGRDGLPADTMTLYGEGDVVLRQRQIAESDATPERKRVEMRKLEALIALCETPRCRRQTLLAAFGESAGPCGNCDICAGEIRFFDGKVEAQKVMSAILRTSGRFFAAHVANILIGEPTAAVQRHNHDALPTFGAGRDRKASEWRSIFRQLHAAELIARDPAEDMWTVTPQGRRVLRGEETIALRNPAIPKNKGAESLTMADTPAPAAASLSTGDASLFAALKAKRLELAKAERLPAYVVFPDRTLLDMAAKRPAHGVGHGSRPWSRRGETRQIWSNLHRRRLTSRERPALNATKSRRSHRNRRPNYTRREPRDFQRSDLRRSDSLEIARRLLAGTLVRLQFVGDLLALVEAAQPSALDSRDMDENVFATAVRLDEAVALLFIVPFHSPCRHGKSLDAVCVSEHHTNAAPRGSVEFWRERSERERQAQRKAKRPNRPAKVDL